jgi:hypothetical protein
MMLWIALGALVFAALAGLVFTVLLARTRKLQGPKAAAVRNAWEHARQQQSDVLKVMEADKVVDTALKLLGFTGSMGDKLKQSGPRFRNVNELWWAHKLRNQLAHELQRTPSKEETKRAMDAFKGALKDLGVHV